jgi:hypothetical protein
MKRPPPDCGKDSLTYREAQKIIKDMTRTARLKGRTIRSQQIYRCGWCNQFHTTSHSYSIPNPKKEMSN